MNSEQRTLPSPKAQQIFSIPALALLIPAILVPAAGNAADTYVLPTVSVLAEYNDNYRLNTDAADEISEPGLVLDARVDFGAQTPTSDVRFTPRIRSSFFPDASEIETTDYFLQFFANKRMQRTIWRFTAGFADESVLTSEQAGADFDDPEFGDTSGGESGVSIVDNDRQQIRFDPSVSRRIGQRSNLTLSAGYVDTSYTSAITNVQNDYDALNGRVAFDHKLSERNTVQLTVGMSQFEAASRGNETDGLNLFGTFTREISQQSTLAFWIGIEDSDITVVDSLGMITTASETTSLYGLSWDWASEISRLQLRLNQRVNPNASGFQVQRSEARLNYSRDLNERLQGRLGLRIYTDDGIGDELNQFRDRDYGRFEAELVWQWTPVWSVVGQYRYTMSEREGNTSDATSHAIGIGIRYKGLRER
jgi:hypothetical protein